ncbi:13631_t:CDS:1, partial [Racocetra fulgida]
DIGKAFDGNSTNKNRSKFVNGKILFLKANFLIHKNTLDMDTRLAMVIFSHSVNSFTGAMEEFGYFKQQET